MVPEGTRSQEEVPVEKKIFVYSIFIFEQILIEWKNSKEERVVGLKKTKCFLLKPKDV